MKYNLVYDKTILNKEPLDIEEAEYQKNLIIINHGYTPEIVPDYPDPPDFMRKMNWEWLRTQKATLVDVTQREVLTEEDNFQIEGIISLIDALQDSAVDEFGFPEDVIFDLEKD